MRNVGCRACEQGGSPIGESHLDHIWVDESESFTLDQWRILTEVSDDNPFLVALRFLAQINSPFTRVLVQEIERELFAPLGETQFRQDAQWMKEQLDARDLAQGEVAELDVPISFHTEEEDLGDEFGERHIPRA